MGQPAIGLGQRIYPVTQGAFEREPVTDVLQNFQCCPPRPDAGQLTHCIHHGRQPSYSSIPRVGLEGIAISRRGMRPARKAEPARFDSITHCGGHGDGVFRLGQRRVHQNAVHSLLHGQARI